MTDVIAKPPSLFMIGPGPWGFETAVRTVWQEARGEDTSGIQAVSHVIWNRLKSGRFGKTLAAVCLEPLQFSGWNDRAESQRLVTAELGDHDGKLIEIRGLFLNARNEPDFTNGAIYYFNPSTVRPKWDFEKLEECGTWGHQSFWKDKFHAA